MFLSLGRMERVDGEPRSQCPPHQAGGHGLSCKRGAPQAGWGNEEGVSFGAIGC